MFALPNVVHFFAHEFAGLSRGRFALLFVLAGAFKSLLFWHISFYAYEFITDLDGTLPAGLVVCAVLGSGAATGFACAVLAEAAAAALTCTGLRAAVSCASASSQF